MLSGKIQVEYAVKSHDEANGKPKHSSSAKRRPKALQQSFPTEEELDGSRLATTNGSRSRVCKTEESHHQFGPHPITKLFESKHLNVHHGQSPDRSTCSHKAPIHKEDHVARQTGNKFMEQYDCEPEASLTPYTDTPKTRNNKTNRLQSSRIAKTAWDEVEINTGAAESSSAQLLSSQAEPKMKVHPRSYNISSFPEENQTIRTPRMTPERRAELRKKDKALDGRSRRRSSGRTGDSEDDEALRICPSAWCEDRTTGLNTEGRADAACWQSQRKHQDEEDTNSTRISQLVLSPRDLNRSKTSSVAGNRHRRIGV